MQIRELVEELVKNSLKYMKTRVNRKKTFGKFEFI